MTQKQPHSRTYLIEATLLVVFILGPAVWLTSALDAKSGSIADWVAALATVAAVVVQVFVPYQLPTTIKIPVLPPDASPRIFTVPTQATSASVGLAMGISLEHLRADRDSVTVAMSFADAAGRTWMRDRNGTLTAVSA